MNGLILFGVAFGISWMATPVVRRLAIKLGIVDRPGPRKIHSEAVPYLGGVVFYLSLLGTFWVVLVYFPQYWLVQGEGEPFSALILGALGILLLGLYDDIRGASARIKLPCQILIAVYMYKHGFEITRLSNPVDFAGGALDISHVGLLVTILWYVALMNGVNLIDGMDGLAAGVVAIAAASLCWSAYADQNTDAFVVSLILLGATVGFLPYNFPPAKIFMGDTGSLLLGFLIASVGILGKNKGSTGVAMTIPLVALGISLLDTGMAFIRRVINRRHPFRADQHH